MLDPDPDEMNADPQQYKGSLQSGLEGPYSFFPDPDPDPEFDVGDQSGSGSGSNTDPGL
jgi:hypothetical protein